MVKRDRVEVCGVLLNQPCNGGNFVMSKLSRIDIHFVGFVSPARTYNGILGWAFGYGKMNYSAKYDYIHLRVFGLMFDILVPCN